MAESETAAQGPWFAEVGRAQHGGGEVIGIGPEADVVDNIVCEIPFTGDAPSARDWAHAHMITAAPDMLAALIAARGVIDPKKAPLTFERVCDAIDKARAAITKATGAAT